MVLIEFFVFFQRQLIGDYFADRSGISQNIALVKLQKCIQLGAPVAHKNLPVAFGLVFGIIQVHADNAVQAVHFFVVQIILGYGHIAFADFFAFSGGQAHIRLAGIDAVSNQFGGSFAGYSEMQFVLYDFKKLQRCFGLRIVIDRQFINIADFLIKAFSPERMSRMRSSISSK